VGGLVSCRGQPHGADVVLAAAHAGAADRHQGARCPAGQRGRADVQAGPAPVPAWQRPSRRTCWGQRSCGSSCRRRRIAGRRACECLRCWAPRGWAVCEHCWRVQACLLRCLLMRIMAQLELTRYRIPAQLCMTPSPQDARPLPSCKNKIEFKMLQTGHSCHGGPALPCHPASAPYSSLAACRLAHIRGRHTTAYIQPGTRQGRVQNWHTLAPGGSNPASGCCGSKGGRSRSEGKACTPLASRFRARGRERLLGGASAGSPPPPRAARAQPCAGDKPQCGGQPSHSACGREGRGRRLCAASASIRQPPTSSAAWVRG
jgi:hypothetical protein